MKNKRFPGSFRSSRASVGLPGPLGPAWGLLRPFGARGVRPGLLGPARELVGLPEALGVRPEILVHSNLASRDFGATYIRGAHAHSALPQGNQLQASKGIFTATGLAT